MAGNQSARNHAHALDIEDWMAQRRADVQRLLQGAEAAGRDLWARSTRTGQNLFAPTPQDVTALGARQPSVAQNRNGAATDSRAGTSHWDNNPRAKAIGGFVAGRIGNAVGVVRSGVHSAQGLRDEALIANHVLNPLGRFVRPPQQALSQQMTNAASKAADAVADAFAHPVGVFEDVRKQVHKWNTELNPSATPQASTFAGELGRNFEIGMNQGEVAADAAALAFGSGALKVIPRLAPISQAAETAKFLDQGFEPKLARYLAQPYRGMGHHSPIPMRLKKFPKKLLSIPMPKALVGRPFVPGVVLDNPFNVLKPNNISRGDFYALHFNVDPEMRFARLPPRLGSAWNGEAMGLKRFGLLHRIWHGTPAQLNTVVGSSGLSSLEADAKVNGEDRGEDQEPSQDRH